MLWGEIEDSEKVSSRQELGVDWEIFSIRKEPMPSGFLALNAQRIAFCWK